MKEFNTFVTSGLFHWEVNPRLGELPLNFNGGSTELNKIGHWCLDIFFIYIR